MPRFNRAIVETTVTGLASVGSPDLLSVACGPSKKPLNIAPRQIAVRLESLCEKGL